MKRLLFAFGFGVFALALHSLFRSEIRRKNAGKRVETVSYDDIALRAYFIGLDREARGEPCSPLQDWEEAERQLSV